MLIDITRKLFDGHPAWPGDPDFSLRQVGFISDKSLTNVSEINSPTHIGTHIDAPWHYANNLGQLESIPLDTVIGPCVLIDASSEPVISKDFLESQVLGERVLVYTGQPNEWKKFPYDFKSITPEAVIYLGEKGVILFGLDSPSVDTYGAAGLPSHQAFAKTGTIIVEGLALQGIPVGSYELTALPLRLQNADGCPVRAVLRKP